MLETHFGPLSALVWLSFMTFGCCAARSAARRSTRDASGADFRPSDVDYEGRPSQIGRLEGSGRSGSLRSFDCRIVIRQTTPSSLLIRQYYSTVFTETAVPGDAQRVGRPGVRPGHTASPRWCTCTALACLDGRTDGCRAACDLT